MSDPSLSSPFFEFSPQKWASFAHSSDRLTLTEADISRCLAFNDRISLDDVRNIYLPVEQTAFTVGGIESFLESAIRNHQTPYTKVLQFTELEAGEKISGKTGFSKGAPLYYVQRLRYLNGVPLILDHNYFLKELVPGLTPEIAEHSVYEYLEKTLGLSITTSKRTMTVERVTQIDETYLDMNDYNCMAVITSQTFNDDGIQFEYTQSRHRPDHFQFQDISVRKRSS